jgi:hypothetical protein
MVGRRLGNTPIPPSRRCGQLGTVDQQPKRSSDHPFLRRLVEVSDHAPAEHQPNPLVSAGLEREDSGLTPITDQQANHARRRQDPIQGVQYAGPKCVEYAQSGLCPSHRPAGVPPHDSPAPSITPYCNHTPRDVAGLAQVRVGAATTVTARANTVCRDAHDTVDDGDVGVRWGEADDVAATEAPASIGRDLEQVGLVKRRPHAETMVDAVPRPDGTSRGSPWPAWRPLPPGMRRRRLHVRAHQLLSTLSISSQKRPVRLTSRLKHGTVVASPHTVSNWARW